MAWSAKLRCSRYLKGCLRIETPIYVITSTANSHVKHIRSLVANHRERRNERFFVIEGVRLVLQALASGTDVPLVLYAPKQLQETEAGNYLHSQLAGRAGCYEATEKVVSVAADTIHPQGVVALARWQEFEPRAGAWLILDKIQDPGNVGTLLRTAEAAGIGMVLCNRGTADISNPKVVRSAMGAHFYVPMRSNLSWDDIEVYLHSIPSIYATVSGAETPYYAVDWQQPSALIIGNEAHGISTQGLALATMHIAIPMMGHISSLNAAVAGSVMMFEILRQKGETGKLYDDPG